VPRKRTPIRVSNIQMKPYRDPDAGFRPLRVFRPFTGSSGLCLPDESGNRGHRAIEECASSRVRSFVSPIRHVDVSAAPGHISLLSQLGKYRRRPPPLPPSLPLITGEPTKKRLRLASALLESGGGGGGGGGAGWQGGGQRFHAILLPATPTRVVPPRGAK